ncbi:substrate-binding periplasmic protein [Paludibacterium purpuratum]|uniref:Amino acid ABC transporter substrate-binding protein (PAAT family) n=1 Tax=Paludibacterium purpuratum TaxID=1144873 RepID=A0A4R7AYZ9_9NEIS|nr:transporter substrate-binding domain-containing protein [Paludibacterium purpuratum]TDR73310.1 amino acid ABC transporter substrate-binding protein (PAAT family) [Paludibacterium purpuratum]
MQGVAILLISRLLPVALLSILALPALAAPPAAHPSLVLAFSPLPPWKVVDTHGKASGPYLDIVQHLADRTGMRLEVHPCPLMRCLEMLKLGEADLGIGIAPGPDRDDIVDFLRPPFAEGSTVCFYRRRDDRQSHVNNYSDLQGLRIGTTNGAHYFPRFDQDTLLIKDSAPDKVSNLRKLLASRVDVVVMVCGEAELLIAHSEFQHRLALAGPPVKTGPRNVVLARHSPLYGMKDKLQRALRQMVESGEIHRMLATIEQ